MPQLSKHSPLSLGILDSTVNPHFLAIHGLESRRVYFVWSSSFLSLSYCMSVTVMLSAKYFILFLSVLMLFFSRIFFFSSADSKANFQKLWFYYKSKNFTFGRIQILRSIRLICEYGSARIPGLMNGTSIDLYGKCLCDTWGFWRQGGGIVAVTVGLDVQKEMKLSRLRIDGRARVSESQQLEINLQRAVITAGHRGLP